jgi:anaerobic selenocysteine-containing dehydrogenase
MPTTEHLRTCPLCEAMCGLRIRVEDGRVTRIRPNHDDVWSRGYICPKGTTLGELHHDPDRLRAPLVRRNGAFVEATWPEAFAECERLLHGVNVPRLARRLVRQDGGMVLISRRHLRSNNSWMHNVPSLMTGRERCTLLVHPEDATRLGLADGGRAAIRSTAGRVEAPVEVSDEMMPGVVCLPHGWGHDRPGARLGVASQHAGVNNNLLAPGELVDVPSGNAVVNGIPVEVAPA